MLTKNTITYLRSLQEKEGRKIARAFLVEGEKNIVEFLASDFLFLEGYFTEVFLNKLQRELTGKKAEIATEGEIERVSTLKSNNVGVAVFAMRETLGQPAQGITLVLDDISDPGNLGTIIRIADWYGVKNIIASEHTVDAYNPKVIMASMGSFTRVNISYQSLERYFENVTGPVYGAYLEGTDIYSIGSFPRDFHLIIGSESHGISQKLRAVVTNPITIPRVGLAESLNAGVATAVILDNITRTR